MAANRRCARVVCAALGMTTATSIMAQQDQALPEIKVQASPTVTPAALPPAYPGGQVSRGGRTGFLGDKDFLDNPFNVQSYTQELIQNQQARTIGDVIQNDPSVRLIKSFGTYADAFFIRGFPVNNDDVAYGGMYGILPRQLIPAEIIERVEVLQRPQRVPERNSPQRRDRRRDQCRAETRARAAARAGHRDVFLGQPGRRAYRRGPSLRRRQQHRSALQRRLPPGRHTSRPRVARARPCRGRNRFPRRARAPVR